MKLRGPIRKIFGFSARDKSKPGDFVSNPFQDGENPFSIDCGKHDVEFMHQTHVNLCGDSCVNMVLKYKGKAHGNMNKNPRGAFTGINTDDVKDRLRQGGLTPLRVAPDGEGATSYTAARIGQYLKQFGPIIATRPMHFVLIIGIDGDRIFYHDPWRGPNLIQTLKQFNRSLEWGDIDRLIAAV